MSRREGEAGVPGRSASFLPPVGFNTWGLREGMGWEAARLCPTS